MKDATIKAQAVIASANIALGVFLLSLGSPVVSFLGAIWLTIGLFLYLECVTSIVDTCR